MPEIFPEVFELNGNAAVVGDIHDRSLPSCYQQVCNLTGHPYFQTVIV